MVEFVESTIPLMDAVKMHLDYEDGDMVKDVISSFTERFPDAKGTIDISGDEGLHVIANYECGTVSPDLSDKVADMLIVGGTLTIYGRSKTHELEIGVVDYIW